MESANKITTHTNILTYTHVHTHRQNEACGKFRTPCMAAVGACLEKHTVTGPDGEVTVDRDVCNCFTKASVDGITVPGKPEMALLVEFLKSRLHSGNVLI